MGSTSTRSTSTSTSTTSTPGEGNGGTGGRLHRYLSGAERKFGAEPGLTRHVLVLVGSALTVAMLVVGVCWMAWSFAAGVPETPPSTERPTSAPARPAPRPPVREPWTAGDVFHGDVYFAVKQTRLSAEAVTVLQDTAARIREDGGTWRVLVQGHADAQGQPQYNLALAQRRAEAVREFLVELGLPAAEVRAVTVSQAGAFCDDPTPACQQLNRRVHLEARRMVQASAPDGETVADAAIFRGEDR